MKIRDALTWFKTNFGPKLEPAVAGTPFSVDMLTAIAYQESGEVWPVLVNKQLGIPKILELCVGDTLDSRSAFPRSKAELLAASQGQEMFRIANNYNGPLHRQMVSRDSKREPLLAHISALVSLDVKEQLALSYCSRAKDGAR
jgi:hypothetical protein